VHAADREDALRQALEAARPEGVEGRTLSFAGLELDAERPCARVDGRAVALTRTEYQLLELFLRNPRRVLTPHVIYDCVWGYDATLAGNSLRVYISHLRRKLEAAGEARLIQTVHWVGYVLRDVSDSPDPGLASKPGTGQTTS